MLRKKQAFQGSAIASFLRYASELATPALTILATVKIKNLEIEPNIFFKSFLIKYVALFH
ncbi:MAG: hypothetical protein MR739_03925 [Spirochaetia bacterium]|nr:hypothetical protein [Spirochaetia bacterium]